MRKDQTWHHKAIRALACLVAWNCFGCALQKICRVLRVIKCGCVQVSVAGYAPNTPQGIKAQKAIDWNSTKV
jgi:hypothetical protein